MLVLWLFDCDRKWKRPLCLAVRCGFSKNCSDLWRFSLADHV